MKQIIFFLGCILYLNACSVQTPMKNGSLTLPSQRAVLSDANDGTDYSMQYSLTQNGKTVLLNKLPVLEAVGSDSIEITELLPGSGYKLALSVGKKVGKILQVKYFGVSKEFSIAEGTNTKVSMSLATAPLYRYLTTSGNNASASIIGSEIYVLDESQILTFTGDTSGIPISETINGLSVRSLSAGKYFISEKPLVIGEELWLNTSNGIYRKTAAGFVVNMANPSGLNIVLSNAVKIENTILALYSAGGASIGIKVASKQSDFLTAWDTPESDTTKKISPKIGEIISDITNDLISSLSINKDGEEEIYYTATPLGTIAGSKSLKELTDTKEKAKIFEADPIGGLKDFWLKIGDGSISITQVSSAGNRVMAGTDKGLYSALINRGEDTTKKSGSPKDGLALITGTKGKKIVALNSIQSSTGVITAAVLSDNSVLLITDTTVLESLDAASGIPSQATPVFYKGITGFLHLILTGTNGAIDYQTDLAN